MQASTLAQGKETGDMIHLAIRENNRVKRRSTELSTGWGERWKGREL